MTSPNRVPRPTTWAVCCSSIVRRRKDWMRQLMTDFRNHRDFKAPWNRKLKYAITYNPVPEWVWEDRHRPEYHVRAPCRAAWPGGERELTANWWGVCKARRST